MTTLTPREFVAKWRRIQLKEITTAQSHFNDVCALVGHPPPLVADPQGQFFTFEATTEKIGGQRGRADVWYKGRFIWEYKSPHADLDKAYRQLLLYREALENPPLLITSDTQQIIIHTNFTDTVKRIHVIDFDRLRDPDGLDLLKAAFHDPQSLKPDQTQDQVTRATADTFVTVVDTLKKWDRAADSERLAHFIIRLLFCLFAEDLGLLPEDLFTKLVAYPHRRFPEFVTSLRALFAAMRDGGTFGFYPIHCFDGGLFDDDFVPHLPSDIMDALLHACRQDWSGIDPSIFGTLFERVIDESKRAQLGAHYTSKKDIGDIVAPVLMRPLRHRWQEIQREARRLIERGRPTEAHTLLKDFSGEIAAVRVLDPACGSGNFLYVALGELLALQKDVIAFAGQHGLDDIPLTVGPEQLYGIEIDPYAHELAQITVWIGYLQWRFENGFAEVQEPILRQLTNIERKDAILAYDADGNPTEPEWPEADVIIGNPPFLGAKWMQRELGKDYTNDLRMLYGERVSGTADLVMYWFEKARASIQQETVRRAGLLATNTVRQGGSSETLRRIKETGDIFMAYTDRPWTLDGAALRVSIVGFDDGTSKEHWLNGTLVNQIGSDLTSGVCLEAVHSLAENKGLSFRGHERGGPFLISSSEARRFLKDPKNHEVIHPWYSGRDLTGRPRNEWIVDFGVREIKDAKQFQEVFEYLDSKWSQEIEEGKRKKKRVAIKRDDWWLHRRPATDLREAIAPLERFIATPLVSKYRLFIWLRTTVRPDTRLVCLAREDDYFFGVLHSKLHEIWALQLGAQHGGERPTYNNTACFETFPFPWPPGQEPGKDDPRVAAIAEAARELVTFRQEWLHPEGVGVVISQRQVKKRTLTNLYNALTHYRDNVKGKQRDSHQWKEAVKGIITLDHIETLDYIHTELDRAVLDAYGWPHTLTDEQILEHLLALNLERAQA